MLSPLIAAVAIGLGWQDGWVKEWRPSVDGLQVREVRTTEKNGLEKVVVRWTWTGAKPLEQVTLAVREHVAGETKILKPFIPGVLMYGNPSNAGRTDGRVPVYAGRPGEFAIFEDHRLPMPFVLLENSKSGDFTAIHTVPSPVRGAKVSDLWWSAGVEATADGADLVLLSGPVGYNGRRSVVKALQEKAMPYDETYLTLGPGDIVEKTYYIQRGKGTRTRFGFEQAMDASLDLFRPYDAGRYPSIEEIVRLKRKLALARWIEYPERGIYGINMYDPAFKKAIVLGWAGASEACGWALPALGIDRADDAKAQKLLDFIATTFKPTIDATSGLFCVRYDVARGEVSKPPACRPPDPISCGQSLWNVMKAIRFARAHRDRLDPSKWEDFAFAAAENAADFHLSPSAPPPQNTGTAFLVPALVIGYELAGREKLRRAAEKIAGEMAARYIGYDAVYWGGTLDANCEDKEGCIAAFVAFQALLRDALRRGDAAAERRWARPAEHAMMMTLSYTVVWDIAFPPGRLADNAFKSTGWTDVSAQNQHLDVFGVLVTPEIKWMGRYLKKPELERLAEVMFRSCGQLVDANGSQGEQIQHTNFAQHGDMSDVRKLRGGYAESWTVFWITAHFLNAAASLKEMDVASPSPADEPFTWGGRAMHPAVVNPVTGQDPANVMSLRGEWEFMKPKKDLPNRNGIWGNFNAKQEWAATRPIRVPGCWEAQGVGEEGMGVSWDPQWDECAKPVRHKYMGEGWYRKTVTIPAGWAGKRIWIKIGGVRSLGWIWVNDVQVALVDNYCGTEKYEITDLVKPGEEAKIVVDVDNRKPSRKGCMSIVHRWGGIYRDIELEATPETFIDDAWVRGDFDGKAAEVHVEIEKVGGGEEKKVGGESGWTADGCLFLRGTVENETAEVPLSTSTSTYSLRVPLRSFRPWSPEYPNLYTARIDLVSADGTVLQTRFERFGVRKFEVRGKEFYLNGKPFYVRGFGDDCVYPLHGLSPADRDCHRAHLRKAREAGFNYVRLHTHCEVPEYCEAADELGIMIQAELPYYSDVPCEGFAFDPKRDATELWKNYRRHPSFAVYSMGNEGSYGKVLDERMHRYVKAMDPDRLKINQDSNKPHMNLPECADFLGGPINVWTCGSCDPDRPFVAHEYLNLCVKSDYRDAPKFTGAWLPPVTKDDRAKWLARFGLDLDWGGRLQDAQHVLQGVWQKNGIEAARRDPYCDGYDYWTVVDVVVHNKAVEAYSGQGLFNPFWEPKRRGLTARDFAVFNSPSVVLCDLPIEKRVWVAGETLRTDVFFAHYGDEPVRKGTVRWQLKTAAGVLAQGAFDIDDQALGASRKVGAIACEIPPVAKSVKAALEIAVVGGSSRFVNAWDVWLFPKGPSKAEILARAKAAGVVIASKDSSEAKAALAAGKNVLTIDRTTTGPNVKLGWWWMGDQVGTAMKNHPALGDFPHEGALTPLWFRLVKRGLPLRESDAKPDEMIIVGEGGKACFLYLAERQIGRSRVLECHGLDLLSDLPEANALLLSLVNRL